MNAENSSMGNFIESVMHARLIHHSSSYSSVAIVVVNVEVGHTDHNNKESISDGVGAGKKFPSKELQNRFDLTSIL